MWPSRVGIKGYFVMYFDRIAVFEALLYRWTSVEGRAHTGFVAVWLSNESTKRIWAPPLTEVQRYRASNTAFSPISCNECPPWSELHVANGVYLWSLRSTAISSMHIWGKKFHIILHWRLLQSSFAYLMRCAALHTPCLRWHGDVQSVVPSGLTLKLLVASLYVIVCLCKHDMDALSWLDAETLKRAPTPLFDGLERCSAHGHSFARLWYVQTKLV